MRKAISALEKKISDVKSNRNLSKEEKDEFQTQYLEAKSQNQYLARKIHELDAEINELKVEESSVEGRKQQRKDEVERMWEKQIDGIQ